MTRARRRWLAWVGALWATGLAVRATAQPEVTELADSSQTIASESETSAAVSDAESVAGSPDAELPAWAMQVSAALGAGLRELDLPVDGAIYQTRSGLFPAVELGFSLDHMLSDRVALGLHIWYQSSLGLSIDERLTDGTTHPRATRAHRLELTLGPTFYVDAQRLWAVCIAVGYGLSDFRPVSHLVTPAYYFAGPYLHVELQLPLFSEHVRLRVGPELLWVRQVGQELVDRAVSREGLGVGGWAALDVLLSQHWAVGVSYRELRSWIGSSPAGELKEVTRFIAARVTGTL